MRPIVQALAASAIVMMTMRGTEVQAASVQEANKKLVSNAMNDLFVRRDASAIQRYFGTPYLQHNPTIPDGADDLPKVIAALPADFKYEPGIIVADGDMVMIHGLYTGWGPKPLVTVDIFRVKDGRLVEHWDVMQEEVPASQTKSGRPMFPITD